MWVNSAQLPYPHPHPPFLAAFSLGTKNSGDEDSCRGHLWPKLTLGCIDTLLAVRGASRDVLS